MKFLEDTYLLCVFWIYKKKHGINGWSANFVLNALCS